MHRSNRGRKIQGTGGKGKVAVMGLLERDGKVRAKVIDNATQATLQGEVGSLVKLKRAQSYLQTDGKAIAAFMLITFIR